LKAEEKNSAIACRSGLGPEFWDDIAIQTRCNRNANSYTNLGSSYITDTGMDGRIVLTGSKNFQVQEIETFEITD
jgi:hypothetical protein